MKRIKSKSGRNPVGKKKGVGSARPIIESEIFKRCFREIKGHRYVDLDSLQALLQLWPEEDHKKVIEGVDECIKRYIIASEVPLSEVNDNTWREVYEPAMTGVLYNFMQGFWTGVFYAVGLSVTKKVVGTLMEHGEKN